MVCARVRAHEHAHLGLLLGCSRELLAGEYPGAKLVDDARPRVTAFRAAHVSSFIDLTEGDEGLEGYELLLDGARYVRLPIRDGGCPTAVEMLAILDRIDTELADGQVVYVHCWGGHGRTGTVVGCWLVRHGAAPAEALARIRELRRDVPDSDWLPSPETGAQREFVLSWVG